MISCPWLTKCILFFDFGILEFIEAIVPWQRPMFHFISISDPIFLFLTTKKRTFTGALVSIFVFFYSLRVVEVAARTIIRWDNGKKKKKCKVRPRPLKLDQQTIYFQRLYSKIELKSGIWCYWAVVSGQEHFKYR